MPGALVSPCVNPKKGGGEELHDPQQVGMSAFLFGLIHSSTLPDWRTQLFTSMLQLVIGPIVAFFPYHGLC